MAIGINLRSIEDDPPCTDDFEYGDGSKTDIEDVVSFLRKRIRELGDDIKKFRAEPIARIDVHIYQARMMEAQYILNYVLNYDD